jgi:hypothetical protein
MKPATVTPSLPTACFCRLYSAPSCRAKAAGDVWKNTLYTKALHEYPAARTMTSGCQMRATPHGKRATPRLIS